MIATGRERGKETEGYGAIPVITCPQLKLPNLGCGRLPGGFASPGAIPPGVRRVLPCDNGLAQSHHKKLPMIAETPRTSRRIPTATKTAAAIVLVLALTAVVGRSAAPLGSASVAESQAEEHGVRLPPGFRMLLYSDHDLADNIYATPLDSQGRVVVTGQGWIKVLHDTKLLPLGRLPILVGVFWQIGPCLRGQSFQSRFGDVASEGSGEGEMGLGFGRLVSAARRGRMGVGQGDTPSTSGLLWPRSRRYERPGHFFCLS